FSVSLDPHVVPSFPTRRSSDLWFNNVETKPGTGYPSGYEDQRRYNGGWRLNRRGKLVLKSGSKLKKLLSIFYNPDMPSLDDYYRSEEHTSELQSRFDLVCRLLL